MTLMERIVRAQHRLDTVFQFFGFVFALSTTSLFSTTGQGQVRDACGQVAQDYNAGWAL
jgi:hypothetical protein